MEIVMKKPTVPSAEKPGCERPPVYRGKPGPQGPAGTIEIAQVVTIEPSDPARVENIGDETNAKLILYIPKGDPGNRGEPGPAVEITEDIIQAIISELDLTPEFVGLGNVDNTSDMDKPVSNPQSAAISAATTMVMSAINNHVANTNNPHGVTIEQIGAAPAGYGLGVKTTETANDLNTCVNNGWYSTGQATANVPAGFEYSSVFVETRIDRITQKLTTLRDNGIGVGTVLIRTSTDNGATWTEEWDNPPLKPGVEYRTTERFNGYPVYKKHYVIGRVESGTTTIQHGIANVRLGLDTKLYANGTVEITGSNLVTNLNMERDKINIITTSAFGTCDLYLSYTKI